MKGLVTGVASPSQPNVFFDLLPPTAKNPSFIVRFDLEIPRPRFVIAHRTVVSSYAQLNLDDRRELIRAAMEFSKRMNLNACSLSVPMGRMCPEARDSRFFAYLNVPDGKSFSNLYNNLECEIPRWEEPSWRTDHWPEQRSSSETVSESYKFGLEEFFASGHVDPEVLLAPRGVNIPGASVRGSHINTSFVVGCDSLITDEFQLNLHSSLPLVGVSYIGQRPGMRVESRWELFDAMYDLLLEHVNLGHRGCFMSVSLSDSFLFDDLRNVIGLIRFPDAVPISLLHYVHAQKKRNRPHESSLEISEEFVGASSLTKRAASADELRGLSSEEARLGRGKHHSSCLELYGQPPNGMYEDTVGKLMPRQIKAKKRKRRRSSCQNNLM